MESLSERGQRAVFDAMVLRLEEEQKRAQRAERAAFGHFVDELVAERKLCARSKWADEAVQSVFVERDDARWRVMAEGQQHRMEGVFVERMEALKERVADSKRAFKHFMKGIKGTAKELVVAEGESLTNVMTRFTALLEGESGDGDGDEAVSAMKAVNEDHVELLLMEYMLKKKRQSKENRECKETENDSVDIDLVKTANCNLERAQKRGNGIQINIDRNDKKRGRDRYDDHKEVSPENGAEPLRKRRKIGDSDSANGADSVEEGEVSDVDDEATTKSNGQSAGHRRSNEVDRHRNSSSSRSRSRSHGKRGRHRGDRGDRRERRHRRTEKDGAREPPTSYGDIVYGIGSDLDEDDLYYKGGVKGYSELSEGRDGADDMANGSGNRRGGRDLVRRRDGGGGGHWRRSSDRQRHHDLDRVDYSAEQEAVIDANSYNLMWRRRFRKREREQETVYLNEQRPTLWQLFVFCCMTCIIRIVSRGNVSRSAGLLLGGGHALPIIIRFLCAQ